jgi:putative tryptophan/tyrosine transport system substrate-binding protein
VQNTGAFLKALRELGYIEGKNLLVEWRFAEGSFERLTVRAADLVQLKVDVIVAVASAAIRAAQKATTIPIVMATTGESARAVYLCGTRHAGRPGANVLWRVGR